MPLTAEDIPVEVRNPLLATVAARPVARVGPAAHGRGLFAAEPLGAGQVAAAYPADFIVGGTTFYYAWASYGDRMSSRYAVLMDSAFFGEPVMIVPSCRLDRHTAFQRAHFINDVKACPGIPTRAEYARDQKRHENARLVNCGDLLVAETTRAVAAGEELLLAYGWRYWAQPIDELPRRVLDRAVFEAVCARLAGGGGRHRIS